MHDATVETAEGHRIPLQDPTTVGRLAEHHLTIDLPAMSRNHATIDRRSGTWWLTDLGSKNGTFVNGAPIGPEPVALTDGDTIVFASAATVLFHDPAVTPIAPRIGRLSGVWIDPTTDAVWVDATRIEPPLSARQLALLKLLDANIGEIVTRSDIMANVRDDAAASGV
ncbi:MAG: FHA domain-containing protein, partial [Actinomycetota bacterium]